jgi:DNA-directed RNA polymerase subunit beta'
MTTPIQTPGQILMRNAVPADMRDSMPVFDKKGMGGFFQELAVKHPDHYIETLQALNNIARSAMTYYGPEASVSLKDFILPPKVAKYREEVRQGVAKLAQNDTMTSQQKSDAIVDYMRGHMDTARKLLIDEGSREGNAFTKAAQLGVRGDDTQVCQLLFGDLLVADSMGRPVPYPGLHGYAEGTTPLEFFGGSYGSRKGFVDVQLATSDTGYFGKQMAYAAHSVRVMNNDCGVKNTGITRLGEDPDIVGSVLSVDIDNLKAGHVIGKSDLPGLADKKVLVRSPLTCQDKEGICQMCTGQRLGGRYPDIGSFVGVDAARVISEPLTQLGLKSKHTGGSVGKNDRVATGFKEVDRFFQMPERFTDRAALAAKDGKITAIQTAPQGGYSVFVNGESQHVPEGLPLTVKLGDPVEAGDILSEGTPNPSEIIRYKGLGEGRRYFVEKALDILKANGVPTHRRNMELVARGFLDKVRITDPNGMREHLPGDIVSYSQLQSEWEPRLGSAQKNITDNITNQYLEQPALHYTIGTRLTPKVISNLKLSGIKQVTVHKQEPGFEPEVTRLSAALQAESDWRVKMQGFDLKRSFLESAAKGSQSTTKGSSYIPLLMSPSSLSEK